MSLCCAVSVLCVWPRVKTGHSTQHMCPRHTKNSNRSKLLIPGDDKIRFEFDELNAKRAEIVRIFSGRMVLVFYSLVSAVARALHCVSCLWLVLLTTQSDLSFHAVCPLEIHCRKSVQCRASQMETASQVKGIPCHERHSVPL